MRRVILSIFLTTAGLTAVLQSQASGLVPIGGPIVSSILPAAGNPGGRFEAAVNSLISVYGSALASSEASAAYPWPLALAGTIVTIDDLPCPLLYIGPSQVNALIPAQLQPGTHRLTLKNSQGQVSANLTIQAVLPEFFGFPVYSGNRIDHWEAPRSTPIIPSFRPRIRQLLVSSSLCLRLV